jgi:sugar lactone lactonase YvrE
LWFLASLALLSCTRAGFESRISDSGPSTDIQGNPVDRGAVDTQPTDAPLDQPTSDSSPDTDAGARLVVRTLAGTLNSPGYQDGSAHTARFDTPYGIAVDGQGTVYVADRSNHCIRVISGGQVSTLAGTCTSGGYQDGPAAAAQFQQPYGVAVDNQGQISVSDWNHRIRAIDPVNGTVSTLAGSGIAGCLDGSATAAQFENPYLITAGNLGEVYVAGPSCKRIRLVASDGTVSTFAGSVSGYRDGPVASALFTNVHGVALDSTGRLYVTDSASRRIRVIDNGQVSTLVGNGIQGVVDGPVSQAQLDEPYGIAVDAQGRVYFTERFAHVVRVVETQ